MIEFNHEKDKRRFLKRNLQIARQVELDEERQRVQLGKIPEVRRPLIERLMKRVFVQPDK